MHELLIIVIIMYMSLLIMYKWMFYYLSFLIIMEFLNVFLIFFVILYLFSLWLFFMFLMFTVCESILGLLLLVSMNYEFGHQKMIFFNLFI